MREIQVERADTRLLHDRLLLGSRDSLWIKCVKIRDGLLQRQLFSTQAFTTTTQFTQTKCFLVKTCGSKRTYFDKLYAPFGISECTQAQDVTEEYMSFIIYTKVLYTSTGTFNLSVTSKQV